MGAVKYHSDLQKSQCYLGFIGVLSFAVLRYQVAALDNGLMQVPAMGYNTWNAFHTEINESLVLETIELMAKLGLVEAGYRYFNIDDGWAERKRDAGGNMVADKIRFPSGIKALADKIHKKGMKLGLYSDAGTATCMSYPASLGFEEQDARLFASWGIDFLKYDNCYSVDPSKMSVRRRYEAMRDALNATGRPIAYSMCEWGVSAPWEYGALVGNSWRTNADISLGIEAEWRGIVDNLDATAGLSQFAGPGGWNDADMLEVGLPGSKKLTIIEQQAHFALWAVIKSPLLIGADLRLLGAEEQFILKAKEVIALNQDPLGVAGDLVWKQGPKEVWAAPLAGGDRGIVLFNRHMNTDSFFQSATLRVFWTIIGFPDGAKVKVRDLFLQKDLGIFHNSFKADVRNHGVKVFRVSPVNFQGASYENWRPWTAGVQTGSMLGPGAKFLGSCMRSMKTDRDCEPIVTISNRLYSIGLFVGLFVGAVMVWAYKIRQQRGGGGGGGRLPDSLAACRLLYRGTRFGTCL